MITICKYYIKPRYVSNVLCAAGSSEKAKTNHDLSVKGNA